jgi:hypothetical protein
VPVSGNQERLYGGKIALEPENMCNSLREFFFYIDKTLMIDCILREKMMNWMR